MSELFDEVDEDVRRDQLKKLWEKYSVVIIAGAILIIASVGGCSALATKWRTRACAAACAEK